MSASQNLQIQTVCESVRRDVACQTVMSVQKSANRDVSSQTTQLFEQLPHQWHDMRDYLNNYTSGIDNKSEDDCVVNRSVLGCKQLNGAEHEKIDKSCGKKLTKLILMNLHPKVTNKDLSMIFMNLKSYQFSKINYYSTGKPLGTADVFFGEKADAFKAKKRFSGKKLDGRPLNIVLLNQEIFCIVNNDNSFKENI